MDQTQNPLLQDPAQIMSAVNTLIQQAAQPVVAPTLPSLNYVMPTGSDITGKYAEFLQTAAKDPSIVNYYQGLLNNAMGDTDLAKQQLENDYQTGVRQTTDTLGNTLKQLGLTFQGEQNSTLDTLNKRGIALTQGPNNTTRYAGGGESQTELGQLNQSQQLRQEAEQRSASQNIQNAGLARTKGIEDANTNLRNTASNIQQNEQQAVTNRANTAYSAYLSDQNVQAAKATADQQSGGGKGDKPQGPPVPGNTQAGVNQVKNGYRWTGSEWV